jgi:hypothetical protein
MARRTPQSLTQSSAVLPAPNLEGLNGLLTAVLAQTTNTQAADSTVDSKSNNLMAAALVIVALLGTQLYDAQSHLKVVAIIAMVLLIVVVVIVLYATRTRDYHGVVVDLTKHPEYFQKDSELLLAQLIEDATKANEYNDHILRNKQQLFRWSIAVFTVGFGLGIIALFIK